MTLELTLTDLANDGAPFEGVAVDVSSSPASSRLATPDAGRTSTSRSIRQASITDSSKAIVTSQAALPKSVCDSVYAGSGYESSAQNLSQVTLNTDNVFGDDGGVSQLAVVTGDVRRGYAVSLVVPVDTGPTPSGGDMPGGGARW